MSYRRSVYVSHGAWTGDSKHTVNYYPHLDKDKRKQPINKKFKTFSAAKKFAMKKAKSLKADDVAIRNSRDDTKWVEIKSNKKSVTKKRTQKRSVPTKPKNILTKFF